MKLASARPSGFILPQGQRQEKRQKRCDEDKRVRGASARHLRRGHTYHKPILSDTTSSSRVFLRPPDRYYCVVLCTRQIVFAAGKRLIEVHGTCLLAWALNGSRQPRSDARCIRAWAEGRRSRWRGGKIMPKWPTTAAAAAAAAAGIRVKLKIAAHLPACTMTMPEHVL